MISPQIVVLTLLCVVAAQEAALEVADVPMNWGIDWEALPHPTYYPVAPTAVRVLDSANPISSSIAASSTLDSLPSSTPSSTTAPVVSAISDELSFLDRLKNTFNGNRQAVEDSQITASVSLKMKRTTRNRRNNHQQYQRNYQSGSSRYQSSTSISISPSQPTAY